MVQNIILYLYNFVILEVGIDLCFAIFVTKFLKAEFKIGSLLISLVCVDTIPVHILSLFTFICLNES